MAMVAVATLAFPAAAAASLDVAITHTESADPVQKGTLVTYTTTVTNQGTETFLGPDSTCSGSGRGTHGRSRTRTGRRPRRLEVA
jgi:hypothetical protein